MLSMAATEQVEQAQLRERYLKEFLGWERKMQFRRLLRLKIKHGLISYMSKLDSIFRQKAFWRFEQAFAVIPAPYQVRDKLQQAIVPPNVLQGKTRLGGLPAPFMFVLQSKTLGVMTANLDSNKTIYIKMT